MSICRPEVFDLSFSESSDRVEQELTLWACVPCMAFGQIVLTRLISRVAPPNWVSPDVVTVPVCQSCFLREDTLRFDLLVCAVCLNVGLVQPTSALIYCLCNPSTSLVTPYCNSHLLAGVEGHDTHEVTPFSSIDCKGMGFPARPDRSFPISYG